MIYLWDVLKLFLLFPLVITGLFEISGTSSLTGIRFIKRKYSNYPPFRRHKVKIKELNELLSGDEKNLKVLDVGCGYGYLLGRLSLTSGIPLMEMHGIDFMPIELVKSRYKVTEQNYNKNSKTKELPEVIEFQYTQADLEREGLSAYSKHSFDVIFCSDVLEHLGNTELVLREIKRCLKPGGFFICSVPNPTDVFDRVRFMCTGNSSRFPLEGEELNYHHVSYFNVKILKNYFRRVGLVPIKFRGDIIHKFPLISRFDVHGLLFSHSIISVCKA